MTCELSVIIPAYNVEPTLDRCVKSVVAEESLSMEVILVDDGSTDQTPRLCDEWARRDSRVCALHQPNGGLSDARNAGLRRARGRYVTFVDSDDHIRQNTYRELLTQLRQHPEYDVLEYPVCLFHGSARQRMLCLDNRAYTDPWQYWTEGRAYAHTYAWNKIYRRQLFLDVAYPVGKVFEDVYTLPLLLEKAKVVATTTSGLYYYTDNSSGITATASGEEWRMLLDAHLRVLRRLPADASTQDYYLQVLNIQLHTNELTADEPLLPTRHIVCPLRVRPFVLLLKALALNALGMKHLCRLNRTVKRMWKGK